MNILIVGAGIAGETLAYWLRRAGHQPTLVERAPELRRGGYLVDFWGAGYDVAERMGIIPELRRRGFVFTEVRAVDNDGHGVASFKPAAVMGPGQRYISVARSDLAAVINDALEDQVELILGDTVAAFDDDGHRVRVSFESGGARDFDLVIGADGLHSRVRRLAFGPEEQFATYLGIVVSAFDVEGYRPRDELVAMMHAEVGFQAVRLSLPEDVTMFLLTVRHEAPAPIDDPAEQQALLRARLTGASWETPAIVELMPTARTFYFDQVSQIQMPSWTRGRIGLVGDAAACPSLLAGQGSALAVIEAFTLAAELTQSEDHVQAFARYQQRLGDFLRSKQKGAVGLGPAFAPKNRRQLLARNLVMKSMGLPMVADLAMGRSFHDAIELPAFAAA